MVTKISKVQQDSSIFKIGHYKCPFFIFGEWSWEKLSRFLYILSIFILKDRFLSLVSVIINCYSVNFINNKLFYYHIW
jgi:hypothetical protein